MKIRFIFIYFYVKFFFFFYSSCVSTSSGLTVILDNPTMVFQPKPERDLNDVEAGATASETSPQVLPHQDSPQQPLQLQQQTSQPQPLEYFPATSSVLRIRRRRSPLHQFAESLLERTRQATTQGTFFFLNFKKIGAKIYLFLFFQEDRLQLVLVFLVQIMYQPSLQ